MEAAVFEQHRAHLVHVGYRITGSLADAEDAVQEAWLRLAGLDDDARAGLRDLRAWLATVVGRLALRPAPVTRRGAVGRRGPRRASAEIVTMTQPNQQPAEMLDAAAPSGTPVAAQVAQNLAPVWDAHGDKWSPVEGGYRAETGDPIKAEILARDVGAIPYDYQPTYGYDINTHGAPPNLSDLQ